MEPLKGSTLLKKGSSGFYIFHTWPIEPFTKKNGSIENHFGVPYMKRGMEPFLVLNRTISSKSVCVCVRGVMRVRSSVTFY